MLEQSDLLAEESHGNAEGRPVQLGIPEKIDEKLVSPEWSVAQTLKDLNIGNPKTPPESPLPFFHLLFRLKSTERAGWKRFGVHNGESIADHMYRMSIMTMFPPPSLLARGLNAMRSTQMALIHDMAELLVGDITPQDGISKPEKSRREQTTMVHLTEMVLGSPENGIKEDGKLLMGLWQEYEDGKTLESRFVHDIDKLELVLQMIEYERNFKRQQDLGEFCHVAEKIELPEVRAWCLEAMKERIELWGEDFKPGLRGYEEVLKFIEAYSK